MTDPITMKNMIDPSAVDLLAAVVDPERKARYGLAAALTELSNEIYKRTIRQPNTILVDECFLTTATSKESVRGIGKAIGYDE